MLPKTQHNNQASLSTTIVEEVVSRNCNVPYIPTSLNRTETSPGDTVDAA